MNRKLIALAVSGALTFPVCAGAVEVAGDALNIYGKIHFSLDSVDDGDNSNLDLSSNSSRIGVKGKVDLDGLAALYQVEQQINVDESGGNWASRNSYVGLGGGFGRVLFGYHDTPMKDVGRKYFDIFGDTVGDSRSVLDEFNIRARNMVKYQSSAMGGLQFNALYSTAYNNQTVNGQDDNDFDLTSLSVTYGQGPLAVALAHETVNSPTDDDSALRLGLKYELGAAQLGLIWEDIEVGGADRSGYGVNVAYQAGKNVFKAQYVIADEFDGTTDSGASQLSVGVDRKLAKSTTLYLMYTNLSNDDNASFRIGGGHGDRYEPAAAGEDVSALSAGLVFKF